MGGSSK